MAATQIDQAKLDSFMGQFVGDLGAALSVATVLVGDRLGLYKAMADGEPVTPAALAARTGTDERYVREWLSSQAASGYVSYNAASASFQLEPEQAMALAQEDSPAFIPGAFQLAAALIKDEPKIAEAFRSGAGVGWHEHDEDLFCGTERFFRPGYIANLVGSWIPALEGVHERLSTGALVADVGCGHGASTLTWPPPTRRVASSASTTTRTRSAPRGPRLRAPAWASVSASRSLAPRTTRDRAMTSWRCSTACTTWATRWEPPRTYCARSHLRAPG